MTEHWTAFFTTLAISCGSGLVLVLVVAVATRLVGRRWEPAQSLARSARVPFRLLVLTIAVLVAVLATLPAGWWSDPARIAMRIMTILAAAWFITAVVVFLEDLGLRRYRLDVPNNLSARRIRTQVLIIRRLTAGVVGVLALGAVLLVFPGAGSVGASVLASAGVFSVVAALAAQSTLGNVFAGLQIAFNNSLRIDDVVVVEDEWGWIEEITLTYVVVHLWDERRLVMPSTYFTTTPFQNWTRRNSELLGSVELDLDWRVSPDGMRKEMDRILAETDLWDGRLNVLQVTDAVNGWVRVRILVTAADAPKLFDLRCRVRECMVDWLQAHNEGGLPRHRVEQVERATRRPTRSSSPESSGLFSGDEEAEERAARITGQIPAIDEPLAEHTRET